MKKSSEEILEEMFGLKELVTEKYEPKEANIQQAAKYLNLAMRKGSTTKDKYQILLAIIIRGLLPSFKNPKPIFQFMKFVAQNISKGEKFKDNEEVLNSIQ